MSETKTDRELRALEDAHADDPERAEVLRRTRRFKASWLELAEALTEVRRAGKFHAWGYDDFQAYVKKELHLRPETAEKLTASYSFLNRRAPHVLRRDGVQDKIPSFEAVEFLRKVEEKEDAPIEDVADVRKRVLEDGASVTSLAKQYGPKLFPVEPAVKKERDTAQLKQTATRLRELLERSEGAPRGLGTELKSLLDKLLEALESRAAA